MFQDSPEGQTHPDPNCKYCYGKGYSTRMYHEIGHGDFPGDKGFKRLKEERIECRCVTTKDTELGEFVRDVTKVGSIAKSEVYRRVDKMLQKERAKALHECVVILDDGLKTEIQKSLSENDSTQWMRFLRDKILLLMAMDKQ